MSATRILVRDELIGFAKSKVMLILWVVLPVLALVGFWLLPQQAFAYGNRAGMTATEFMSIIVASLAGTVAAMMVAVDIVTERNRNVFVLFAIRPIRREVIVWSKFLGVFVCVGAACTISLLLGLGVDLVRGTPVTTAILAGALHGLATAAAVIALSAAVGVLFGVMARSVLVAVLLVLYVGQNVAIVPMLPTYLGMLPNKFWIFIALSAGLVGFLLWVAGVVFRRAQL